MMKETRNYTLTDIEIRDVGFNKPLPRFRGHAAVFNSLSHPMGRHGKVFREQIAPGAFTRALEDNDVVFLVNHDPNLVLGRTSSGTLKLGQDERGLWVEGDMPDTSYAKDLVTLMERRDITQMSFGFNVRKDSWEKRGKESIRTLHDVELLDVSAVTLPAYEEATIDLEERMIATALAEVRAGKAISSKNRDAILSVIEVLSGLVADEADETSLQRMKLQLRERELF